MGNLVVVPGAIRGNRFKWLRGARAANGDMFGIPCNANKVLRISTRGEVDMIGDPELLSGHWKWHGGVLHANGNLYGCPCNSERVLKIDPRTAEVSLVGGPFPGKQKWYGSLIGGDGCMYLLELTYILRLCLCVCLCRCVSLSLCYIYIPRIRYCIPNCAGSVLKFDPVTGTFFSNLRPLFLTRPYDAFPVHP